MKKLFYTLGAVAAATTPIIAVVSCGTKADEETQTPTTDVENNVEIEQETEIEEQIQTHYTLSFELWQNYRTEFWNDLLSYGNIKINDEQVTLTEIPAGLIPSSNDESVKHRVRTFETETKKYYLNVYSPSTVNYDKIQWAENFRSYYVDKTTGEEVEYTSQEQIEAIKIERSIEVEYSIWSKKNIANWATWWRKLIINDEPVVDFIFPSSGSRPKREDGTEYRVVYIVTATKRYVLNNRDAIDFNTIPLQYIEINPSYVEELDGTNKVIYTSQEQIEEIKVIVTDPNL